jgi:hypothetical protein
MAAILAAAGLVQLRGMSALSRGLLLSWLGAAGLFALLDRAVGDTIRWYYVAAAPVALLAGRYLALLAARRRAAALLVALSILTVLFQTLGLWVGEFIFLRYH